MGSKPVVAVVDDDPLFLDTLVDDLCDHGFAAIGLNGPAATRDYFAAGRSATIMVLDWQMPGLDGLQATREIRAIESGLGSPRVPVLALTAQLSVRVAFQAF